MPELHVVVAAVLVRDDRALLVHRSPSRQWYPDVWDIPGGHVVPGETPARALERELFEELGVVAHVSGEVLARVEEADLLMDVWAVRQWEGVPVNRAPDEHDALAWLEPADLEGRPLAHPDLPAIISRALAG